MQTRFDSCEIIRIRETREYAAMKQLLESLNSFQNAPENYLAALSETHRTIQQLFFRLVRQCVLYMAEPGNVIIDDRNRASYHLCQKIADQMRDHHLPII